MVAQDILGLLKEEVSDRHEILLTEVFDLLYNVMKYATTDELNGSNMPITLLPIFFHLKLEHMPYWRRVAMIFVEIIRASPNYFDIWTEEDLGNTSLEQVGAH